MNTLARTSGAHERNAWLLIAYIASLFFGLGTGLFESFLSDPMCGTTGTPCEHPGRSGPLLVAALALRVPVTLALLWHRPHLFPHRALGVAATGQLFGWASGGVIALPLTLTGHGLPGGPFDRFVLTDRVLRVLAVVCEAVAELWVLWRVADELAAAPARAAGDVTSRSRHPTR